MLYLQQQSVTASLPLSDALKINVVRQRHRRSTTVMEGGVGWGGGGGGGGGGLLK